MTELLIFVAGMLFATLFALAAAFGVIVARTNNKVKKEPPKPAYQPTDEEVRKAKRLQKEVINMLSYNGEPQEEIIDD